MMSSVNGPMAGALGVMERTGHVIQQETGLASESGDLSSSLTDLTLEQAVRRLGEIQRDNIALRDNMKKQNGVMKQQYEALSEWRKREADKFEQTKALITALREENQDLQVKVMTLDDKIKDLETHAQSLEEEKGHLLRQKTLSDQKAINIEKQAEEQGILGLGAEGCGEEMADAVVYVSTVDKEEKIMELEAFMVQKDDRIATLRAELLKKEEEVAKFRESTKHLLKDMESQQKIKQVVESENRALQNQIMQAEQKLHQHMQSMIQSTKRELKEDQMFSSIPTDSQRPLGQGDGGINPLRVPGNMEDLEKMAAHQSVSSGVEVEKMKREAEDARQAKAQVVQQMEQLEHQLKELRVRHKDTEQQLRDARQEVQTTADRLGAEYEQKLIQVAKQSSGQETRSFEASNTEDMSILRSQVLTLLKEVDEKQNNLSAAMAAINNKNGRILELEEMNRNLQNDYNYHWQETHSQIQNLRQQLGEQLRVQQENSQIKQQHVQLQASFSQLVTDYKELVELKAEGQRSPTQYPKDLMEELNRLTAQVMAADEAITLRDEEIARHKNQGEEIEILKVQAELFKNDFNAERESRTKLAEERNMLRENAQAMQKRNQDLLDKNRELTEKLAGCHNQRQINEMQWRHMAGGQVRVNTPPNIQPSDSHSRLRATPPLAQDYRQTPGVGGNFPLTNRTDTPPLPAAVDPWNQDDEEPQSLRRFDCPTCNAVFPDLDSLQLHVVDCMGDS